MAGTLTQLLTLRQLEPGAPFPCPYLRNRTAQNVTILPRPLSPGLYHSLMNLNFRRLGPVFYLPRCPGCDECRMIRIPVRDFRADRAQRRCWKRNADLVVEVVTPTPTPERYDLYRRYLEARHDGQMDASIDEFHQFLYSSPINTVEFVYRLGGEMMAVGVADIEPAALSAVYCYFDPQSSSMSPGVFNILWMIDECRRRGLEHLYLGYLVKGCSKMSYKAMYHPHEILQPDGTWLRVT